MKLADIDKIIGIKGSGEVRQNITFDDLSIDMLKRMGNNRSFVVRTAIHHLYYSQYMVYSIVNTINHRVFYVVDKSINYYSKGYLSKFLLNNNVLDADISEFGINAFDITVLGIFNDSVKALNYRDYLINDSLNDGLFVYNSETYTGVAERKLFISMDHRIINLLAGMADKRKITLNKFILRVLKTYLKSKK